VATVPAGTDSSSVSSSPAVRDRARAALAAALPTPAQRPAARPRYPDFERLLEFRVAPRRLQRWSEAPRRRRGVRADENAE
jgi:hypothetical protein